jgi:hypothetical protein
VPDHLVDGVVPPDVLPDPEPGAVGGEQAGGVQTAGPVEDPLGGAQHLREAGQHGGVQHQVVRGQRPGPLQHQVDLLGPADAAGAADPPGQAAGGRFDPGGEPDLQAAVAAGDPVRDVLRAAEHALAEQEAERQLQVMAGGAHGDRERLAVHPDLQRLLDGEGVRPGSVPVRFAGGTDADPADRAADRGVHEASVEPRERIGMSVDTDGNRASTAFGPRISG